MRLAVVSPFLDRQHGTEHCLIEQLKRFVKSWDITIELYSQRVESVNEFNSELGLSPSASCFLRWHHVSEIPGPHLISYLWWLLANHWRRWVDRKRHGIRPDLVYTPGINCLDADVIVVHVLFHALHERVRTQLRLCRNPVKTWPRVIHRKLYYRLAMLLESCVYRNPRIHLIAVSNLVAKKLNCTFGRKDVMVIPNGVDTARFNPEARQKRRSEARRLFHFGDGDFVVLLIGNDWRNKGFTVLLEALGKLKHLPFSMRGLIVGSDDTCPYWSLIEDFRLQRHIHFELPSPDVLQFYAAADLYAAPSLEDAFNLPIVEAMACGLPVIASAHAGATENIQDSVNGLVLHNPMDSSELSRLIQRMADDLPLRKRLGAAAAVFVKQNCDWDTNVSKTVASLEVILRDRPAFT